MKRTRFIINILTFVAMTGVSFYTAKSLMKGTRLSSSFRRHTKLRINLERNTIPVADLSHLHQLNSSELRTGTVYMKSKNGPIVPVSFAFKHGCPVLLKDEFLYLAKDATDNLLISHRDHSERWPPVEQLQESISTFIEKAEFRLTVDFLADGKMNHTQFAGITRLLLGTVKGLYEVGVGEPFESASFTGLYNGFAFQSWWTWYFVVDGTFVACRDTGNIPHIEL